MATLHTHKHTHTTRGYIHICRWDNIPILQLFAPPIGIKNVSALLQTAFGPVRHTGVSHSCRLINVVHSSETWCSDQNYSQLNTIFQSEAYFVFCRIENEWVGSEWGIIIPSCSSLYILINSFAWFYFLFGLNHRCGLWMTECDGNDYELWLWVFFKFGYPLTFPF